MTSVELVDFQTWIAAYNVAQYVQCAACGDVVESTRGSSAVYILVDAHAVMLQLCKGCHEGIGASEKMLRSVVGVTPCLVCGDDEDADTRAQDGMCNLCNERDEVDEDGFPLSDDLPQCVRCGSDNLGQELCESGRCYGCEDDVALGERLRQPVRMLCKWQGCYNTREHSALLCDSHTTQLLGIALG